MYTEEFRESVSKLMFAHGDVRDTDPECLNTMCGLVTTYVNSLLAEVCEIGSISGSFDTNALLHTLIRSPTKFKAVKEMLQDMEKIKGELFL